MSGYNNQIPLLYGCHKVVFQKILRASFYCYCCHKNLKTEKYFRQRGEGEYYRIDQLGVWQEQQKRERK